MKKLLLLTGMAGGLFAATARLTAQTADDTAPPAAAAAGANDTAPAPDQAPPPDQTPQATTNTTPQPVDMTPQPATGADATATPSASFKPTHPLAPGEKGLIMNFHDVQLVQVLNYMSKVAGFIIHPKVDVSGTVTMWNDQPMSKEDAVALLKQVLNEHGYAAIDDGRVLTIETLLASKKDSIQVGSGSDFHSVPSTPEMRTQIIPVKTLNVMQLVKELEPLKSSDATLTADEAANSLLMTDTQGNIRHMMEIIGALDGVTSGSSSVKVFPLKYADAKSTATLITTIFPNPDNSATGARGAFPGMGGRGGRGGAGGFAGGAGGGGNPFAAMFGGDTGGENNGHTPTAKVNATSDDHSNSLIVSAPDGLMATIADLVNSLDVPVEDATVAQVFHLKNADPGEMADLLTALFPDDTGSSDATGRQVTFGGFGRGGLGGGARGGAANTSTSDRMKKMAHVTAVADKRTKSLVVTAGKDVLPQIADMIAELDSRTDRKVMPHAISLENADPALVQQLLQEQFQPFSNSAKSSSTTLTTGLSPLYDRTKTMTQQMNQSATSSFGSSSGGGGGSGRGGL